MTDAATAELLGVRKAACALGCNASTVTRYLQSHPNLNHGSATRPKVDVAEFSRHRAETTNPARRGSHAGRLFGESDDLGADEGAGKGAGKGAVEDGNKGAVPTYATAKAVREGLAAQRARIELDQLRGLLVSREEVETAAYEAGQKLQRDLLALGLEMADKLATMADPGEIAALIEAEHRRLLESLAPAFKTEEPIGNAA